MKLALALAALAVALAAAAPALADDSSPSTPALAGGSSAVPLDLSRSAAPEVRYPPSSVRPKLVIGGLAISGLAYGAAIGTASNWPEVPGAAGLKIPFVGPWLALGQSGCALD